MTHPSFGAPPPGEAPSDHRAKLGDLAASAGIRRVHILAWRDLADVEAGGSELHAATVAKLWSEAGIEVLMRTSFAQGSPPTTVRDGYQVIRRAGRYAIFPRAVLAELRGHHGERDALVEIWNGVPFFTPLWVRGPRVTFLHHHHEKMWPMVLSPKLAGLGAAIETHIAPPLYRRSTIVTLSESSRRDLIAKLRLRPDRVRVVPPGVDDRFTPSGKRSDHPLIVTVGRLMPSKRFDMLIRAVDQVRRHRPDVELVIVGEGYERDNLMHLVDELHATEWVRLAGRVTDEDLVNLYRRAWLVASASISEGWGMTLTEAAACATPAVATRIPGHEDAVIDGSSGLLVDPVVGLEGAISRVLLDDGLRTRLQAGALAHARRFTWNATALGTMQALVDDARRHRPRHR
jgi:glycosyltransferase involved in cell wall biosynthesis